MQVLSAGADGLLKLWSVRSGECVATFDEHADKVRATGCSIMLLADVMQHVPACGLTVWLMEKLED